MLYDQTINEVNTILGLKTEEILLNIITTNKQLKKTKFNLQISLFLTSCLCIDLLFILITLTTIN